MFKSLEAWLGRNVPSVQLRPGASEQMLDEVESKNLNIMSDFDSFRGA